MITRTNAELALAALSKEVGVSKVSLDTSDTALIAFGRTYELIFHFQPDINGFHLWSPLHDITLSGNPDDDVSLLRHILKQNFPSTHLNGAHFALDAEVGVVLLGLSVPVDPSAFATFVEKTQAFAQQVIDIASVLKRDAAQEAEQMQTSDPYEEDMTVVRV